MHLCLCAVRIVDRRKAIALYLLLRRLRADGTADCVYWQWFLEVFLGPFSNVNDRMNEWMMHFYIAFYCVLLYTQSTVQSCGGSLLNHLQCAASTWMMRLLPQDNGASALTTHHLQVERRESHRANQVDALTTHQLQVERRESHRANNQVDGDY